MKKVLAAVALIGAAGVVQAAPATLTGVTTYSANGSAAWVIASAGTWDLNTSTGVATMQGAGAYTATSYVTTASSLMTQSMTGVTLSSGTAVGTTWTCAEGTFGGGVGASICGNYKFNKKGNQSTYNPTATGATVTIGGDDTVSGPPQTLANSYSGMTLENLGGGNWGLYNRNNANPSLATAGYTMFFNVAVVPVPAAVWLFGSALGLMGAMRRRSAV